MEIHYEFQIKCKEGKFWKFMKNILKNKLVITAIVLVLLIGAYYYFIVGSVQQFMQIDGLYDENKNPISLGNALSVVGGVEGVKYVTLKINVENKDTIPLTLNVKSMTPSEISQATPTTKITVKNGEFGSWTTGLIDIEPYGGKVQDFCATVEAEKIPALREAQQLSGCISIKVDPNPIAKFGVSLDSNVGSNSINPGCTENWQCTSWSGCSNSIQTRTCTDSNNCGTSANKPSLQQACQVTFTTNAVSGNYKSSSVWIDFGNGPYSYSGYSTYRCSTTNTIKTTPEGNAICTKTGYDITSRVYLDDGSKGLIFEP